MGSLAVLTCFETLKASSTPNGQNGHEYLLICGQMMRMHLNIFVQFFLEGAVASQGVTIYERCPSYSVITPIGFGRTPNLKNLVVCWVGMWGWHPDYRYRFVSSYSVGDTL